MFTLLEVECLGACVNAPMIQLNDDFYVSLGEAVRVAYETWLTVIVCGVHRLTAAYHERWTSWNDNQSRQARVAADKTNV